MTTATDCAGPVLVSPATLAGSHPSPRGAHDRQPLRDPHTIRGLSHPHELVLHAIPVTCPACDARRDWLLISRDREVWVRCRCGNQWLEPEITRADYDAMIAIPDGTTYPCVEQGLLALGFDGSFAGIYVE